MLAGNLWGGESFRNEPELDLPFVIEVIETIEKTNDRAS